SGGRIDATPDVAEMERQIAKINPADAGRFGDFLAENRTKLAKFRPILENPFSSWKNLASPSLAAMLPLIRPWLSLDGELKRHFSDPRLRVAFSFQSKYLGMSPFRCPSLFSILSFLEYEHGVWHPTGGCAAVSDRMAEIAVELGVDLRLDTEVTGLRFDGKKPVAVEIGPNAAIPCDALVINADFGRAMTKLVPNRLRKNWTDAKIGKKKFSCSTYMLYLGIDGLERELPHHTIYIAEDYEKNLREIETERILSDDPSIYVQNACVTDPSLAPDGCSTLYILAPVTHESPHVDWDRDAAAFRERVLDQVESKFGVSDLRNRIRYEKQITPDDWNGGYEIYKGATFNLAHNLTQMLHFRPRNRFEDLDGTYLVGGGTHPGSGLPVIYESARISSRLLAKDHGLNEIPSTALPDESFVTSAAGAPA
ncbi:MAG: phytoene desaturase family protein, partial [Planctomycetota bacterium]